MDDNNLKVMLIQPLLQIGNRLLDHPFIKGVIAFLIYIISLIYSNPTAIYVLVFLIIADTVTGISAAIVRHEKISSRKFRNSAIKLFFYSLLIAVLYQLEKVALLFEVIQLDNLMISYLAVTEALSILENTTTVTNLKYPSWLTGVLTKYIATGKND